MESDDSGTAYMFPVKGARKKSKRKAKRISVQLGEIDSSDASDEPHGHCGLLDENFGERVTERVISLGSSPPRERNTEALLYVSSLILKCGLSADAATHICETLPVYLTGMQSNLKFRRDVLPFMESLICRHAILAELFCSSCTMKMPSNRSLCLAPECNLFKKSVKRGKDESRVLMVSVQIAEQIREILSREIEEILAIKRKVHSARGCLNSGVDNHLYPYFVDNMESEEDFEAKRIILQLGLSYDGAIYRRLSRAEVWPLFFEVISLSMTKRRKLENSILCSLYFGSRKPSKEILASTFARISNELEAIMKDPIIVNGWSITCAVITGQMDMAGQKLVFGLPSWKQYGGCSKCTLRGVREKHHMLWSWKTEANPIRRTEADYFDAETSAMKIVLPSQCPMDWLHCCQEGIMINRIKELLGRAKKFEAIRLSKKNIGELDKMLKSINNYKYADAQILNLANLSGCSGYEIEQMYSIVIPLVCTQFNKEIISKCIILGEWLVLRLLNDTRWNSYSEQVRHCKELSTILNELVYEYYPILQIMKRHMLFEHFVFEEANLFGPPCFYTTATSERWHKELQIRMNQYSTSLKMDLVKRYMTKKAILNSLSTEETETDPIDRLIKHRTSPASIEIFPNVSITKTSVLKNLHPQDEVHRWETSSVLYKSMNFYGHNISSIYGSSHQEENVICFRRKNGSMGFGKVLFFENTQSSCYIVVNVYIVGDPFVGLREATELSTVPAKHHIRALINLVCDVNAYFFLLVSDSKLVQHIPCDRFVSAAIIVCHENRSTMKRVFEDDEEEEDYSQGNQEDEEIVEKSVHRLSNKRSFQSQASRRNRAPAQSSQITCSSSQELLPASYKQFGRAHELSLLDIMKKTVNNGVFDSVLAATNVMEYREMGKFIQSDYDTFISMLPSLGFRTFESDIFPRRRMDTTFVYVINKIRSDATAAMFNKQEKNLCVVKRHVATELQLKESFDLKFVPTRLSSDLCIESNGDFKNLVFSEIMNSWPGIRGSDSYKKINSAIRFVLGEMTTIPEDIKKYCSSLTVQGSLHPLPIEVVSVLKKFVLQLAQLHHNIFNMSVDEVSTNALFLEKFMEFGTDEKTRRSSFRRQQLLRDRLICEFPNILKEAFHHIRRSNCELRGTGEAQQRIWTRK